MTVWIMIVVIIVIILAGIGFFLYTRRNVNTPGNDTPSNFPSNEDGTDQESSDEEDRSALEEFNEEFEEEAKEVKGADTMKNDRQIGRAERMDGYCVKKNGRVKKCSRRRKRSKKFTCYNC